MTERKPPGVSWQTWIDRQIEAGQERGEFDGLAGHGKPIDGIDRPRDELWWVRDKLKREGVNHLPPSLAILRKASKAVEQALQATSEAEARRIVDEINAEIRQLNRLSVQGPPTTLMPYDVEEIVEVWHNRTPPEPAVPDQAPDPAEPVGDEHPGRTRRRPRLGHRRR